MMAAPSEIEIVAATKRDIDGMIAVHARAFADEFLTLLGDSVLRSFYEFYATHDRSICLVARDPRSRAVIGLVCGGDPSLRGEFIRQRTLPLIRGSIIGSLKHGRVRVRLCEHLKLAACRFLSRRSKESVSTQEPPGKWASLLSICADPARQGSGVGRALMEAYREACQHRGYESMRLSVHNDNTAAISLYQRCGWSVVSVTSSGTYFVRSTNS